MTSTFNFSMDESGIRIGGAAILSVDISPLRELTVSLEAAVLSYGQVREGSLIHAVATPWKTVAELLAKDFSLAFRIPPYKWEEIIAAAFDRAGYDQVILTPRSGDFGRDVIAVKNGEIAVRIIGSVKAYKFGHRVGHDDVRALLGVLSGDFQASKAILTTTSDFAPGIFTDPFIKQFIPYRLELMNGNALQQWFTKLK